MLSCKVEGSLGLTIFLSETAGPQETAGSVIPRNSVLGRMVGTFETHVSTPTRQVTANGTAGWIIGGTYDSANEAISVAIRSSDVDAKGTDAALEKAAQGTASTATPFSTNLSWGWRAPRDYSGQIVWGQDPSTILDAMRASATPSIPSEREADLLTVNSLPQTGLKEFQRLVIDLKEPQPQSLTRTIQDETDLEDRTTTWAFTLIPHFNIERDNSPADGRHSFVSTDSISLHMEIPGVTVAKSGWANLPSWEVKGLGPFSGNGVPGQLPHSTEFSFQPKLEARPTDGSTTRNRPIQYTVSASFGGSFQYFLLIQDEVDILRQEYIDHKEGVVPSRGDCVAHPVDNSFNVGNYNVIVDSGMQAALDKVALEFRKDGKEGVLVIAGFRCPQRNKAAGDAHPNSKHVLGRALDLAPKSASVDSMRALYQACVRAGHQGFCEAAPGKRVSPDSPDARHVHIEW